MYRFIIRPVLFLFSPESIHHFLVRFIWIVFRIPGVAFIVRKFYEVNDPALERKVFGLTFRNPVGFAAGFDKNAEVFEEFSSFGFSFIEIGTVTPDAQPGNPRPRVFRVVPDKAIINRMGINNYGVKAAVARLKNRKHKVIVGGNIGRNTATPNAKAPADYEYCFRELYDHVDYIAINVSCPNVESLTELQEKDMLREILERLVRAREEQKVKKPVLLKISPDLNNQQLDETIDIAMQMNIDGIIAINTTRSRSGLSAGQEEINRIGNGGLSGKPLNARSTEMIAYIVRKTGNKMPVIGVGGIMSPRDALDKLKAGASLVQVYTGFIYEGPGFVKKINKAVLRELR